MGHVVRACLPGRRCRGAVLPQLGRAPLVGAADRAVVGVGALAGQREWARRPRRVRGGVLATSLRLQSAPCGARKLTLCALHVAVAACCGAQAAAAVGAHQGGVVAARAAEPAGNGDPRRAAAGAGVQEERRVPRALPGQGAVIMALSRPGRLQEKADWRCTTTESRGHANTRASSSTLRSAASGVRIVWRRTLTSSARQPSAERPGESRRAAANVSSVRTLSSSWSGALSASAMRAFARR